ncbi:Myosin-9 protein [Spatholobus suberectus]|nr:Myosin-9 protein [Spatholobus suberectus]
MILNATTTAFILFCAAPQEEIEKYKLGSSKTFQYLNQSKCYELADISDSREYLATRKAIDIVGISQKEQEAISELLLQFFILGILILPKERKLIHQFQKMTKPNST